MIFISFPNGKRPPEEWVNKSKQLRAQLEAAATPEARSKVIKDNQAHWGEIKEWLAGFSNDKCWFSESPDAFSHMHVEHFRPKRSAKGSAHCGYWWLCFDFTNYRYCGGVANVKKGSFFPVRDGTSAALGPDNNHEDEDHELIDPTRAADVALLTFTIGAVAIPSITNPSWDRQRAQTSIKRYGLNSHPVLKRARSTFRVQCETKLLELEEKILENQKSGTGSPTRREKIETLRREIRAMAQPDQPYAGMIRRLLVEDSRDWVRGLLA